MIATRDVEMKETGIVTKVNEMMRLREVLETRKRQNDK